jgi:hypothetical protein
MVDRLLYDILVPDRPLHRRTERDIPLDITTERRTRSVSEVARRVQPGLQSPSLISSYEGQIHTILFSWPAYAVADPALAAGYQSLIEALRKGMRFVVVHHESVRRVIERWFRSAGHSKRNVTLVPVPDYVSLTDWAEDAYVALEDAADGSRYLMEPWEFPRAGDALIAESVQEYADIRASQAPLIFQGGNCLIGDDFWLLGKDYFADSVDLLSGGRPPVEPPPDGDLEAMVRELFREYVDAKRELIVFGTRRPIPVKEFYGTRTRDALFLDIATDGVGTFQPIFHIDMFTTLLGRARRGPFRVMVGSPALADEILQTTSPLSLNNVYDRLAKDLEARGLEVLRAPLVHRPTLGSTFALGELREIAQQNQSTSLLDAVRELSSGGADDSASVIVRTWHHITWNNCLVESGTRAGGDVYLPTYGHGDEADLAVIDEHMRDQWRGLGYTVHMLGDFNEFARRQGVVHCIKKYLRRSA